MTRDPFYDKIIKSLGSVTDGNLFEKCVADLLRADFPSLVPVPGGNDAGLDGTWADTHGRGILVTTIQRDVIGNVTRNLNTHKSKGRVGYRVLVATTQQLSELRCRNIESRVNDLGFVLAHHVYHREAIAQRLYHNSLLCRALLGFSGRAGALTRVPGGIRGFLHLPLVGRDEDLAWLTDLHADRLLVGQPGIGKSFLLQSFVVKCNALFAMDESADRLADAVRDQCPESVIVDDAHVHLDLLRRLIQVRTELGASFHIVAVGWPGDTEKLRVELDLPENRCRTLQPLRPEKIVEILHSAGIRGPRVLLHELVRQSLGCPGRAAILVRLCLDEGTSAIADGAAILRWVKATFTALLDEKSIQILAAFAVGGEHGVAIDTVARHLGYAAGDIRLSMAKLAVGGLVRDSGAQVLIVNTEPLRSALIRDYYCNAVPVVPVVPLVNDTYNSDSTVCALIRAYARGANISVDQLRTLVWRSQDDRVWEDFAWSGRQCAETILSDAPRMITRIPTPLLHCAPELALPQLLEHAVGDDRTPQSTLGHALNVIEGWALSGEPGSGDALTRREVLRRVACEWLVQGSCQKVGLSALRLAMSPRFESNESEPGHHLTFTHRRGLLPLDQSRELALKWPEIIAMLKDLRSDQWTLVLALIDDWVWWGRANVKISEDYEELFRTAASTFLEGLIGIVGNHPGVLREIRSRAEDVGVALECEAEGDFQVLFPAEADVERWDAWNDRCTAAVHELADRWSKRPPKEVAAELSAIINEARVAGISYPDLSDFACSLIANRCADIIVWIDALIDAGFCGQHVGPFLRHAVGKNVDGWLRVANQCLEMPNLRLAGVNAILGSADAKEESLEKAIAVARNYSESIRWGVSSGNIREEYIGRLLNDEHLAHAAAYGLWNRKPEGEVPDALFELWSRAVVQHLSHEYTLIRVFDRYPVLAREWLVERTQIAPEPYRWEEEVIHAAARSLSVEERRKLLLGIRKHANTRIIVRALVNEDGEVYRELLARRDLSFAHLYALCFGPTDAWAELAVAAYEAGYRPAEIAGGAVGVSESFCGSPTVHFRDRVAAWDTLLGHADGRVREIAAAGKRAAEEQLAWWKRDEEQREFADVYG